MNETDKAIKDFLESNKVKTDKIRFHLKKRNFIEIKDSALEFLKQTQEYLTKYKDLNDYALKRAFLENLTNAWEIADASNIFNRSHLARAYDSIKNFSTSRFKEIADANQGGRIDAPSNSANQDKEYFQEAIRNSLIFIGEQYRSQDRLEECQRHLEQLFTFIKNKLEPKESYHPNVIKAQCHYYSAKIARFQGNLYKSEKELIAACENLRDEAKRLSKSEDISEDIRLDRLNEIQLVSGVLEVSHAWLNFSQGRYESAKYTALNALLMLAGSRDRLTQLHAELVIAAAKRATAKSTQELEVVVKELKRLQGKFGGKKHKHPRLKSKTDYEYVLALIMLDSLRESPPNPRIEKDPLSDAYETLVNYRRKERISNRWISLLNTLESHYLRRMELRKPVFERNFERALEAADMAYEQAQKLDNPLCLVEALFSRGEIYFELHLVERQRKKENTDFLEKAQISFDKADSLCADLGKKGGFRDLQGAVKLYLARISISNNRLSFAKYYLDEFRVFKNLEHAWLNRIYKSVENELRKKSEPEILEIDSPKLSVMLDKLIPELVRKAKAEFSDNRKPTEKEISDIIGISRGTFRKWRKNYRLLAAIRRDS